MSACRLAMRVPGFGWVDENSGGDWPPLAWPIRSHSGTDSRGSKQAAAACYDPQQAIGLWERMSQSSGGEAPPEFASTHPNPGTRIQTLQSLMPKAMEYRQKFCR